MFVVCLMKINSYTLYNEDDIPLVSQYFLAFFV